MKSMGRALPAMLAGNPEKEKAGAVSPHHLPVPYALALSLIGKMHPALKIQEIK